MHILPRLIQEVVSVHRKLGHLSDDYDPEGERDRSTVSMPRHLKLRVDHLRQHEATMLAKFNMEIASASAHDLGNACVEVDSMRSEVRERRLKMLNGTSPWEVELRSLRQKIEVRNEEILLSSMRKRFDQALLAIEWKNYHETNMRRQSCQVVPLDHPVTSIKQPDVEPLSEEQLSRRTSVTQKEAAAVFYCTDRTVRNWFKAGKLTPTERRRVVIDSKFKAMKRKTDSPVIG